MKCFGITGWKNAGKTGLIERLVPELVARGYSVSTLKHAHHRFEVDHEGRDSYRHRAAGAGQVLVAGADRWALMTDLRGAPEPDLAVLLSKLDPVDIVLIEGWKSAPHPKIEVWRAETGHPLMALGDQTIRAVATDAPLSLDCPVLDMNDAGAVADFLLQSLGGAGDV